LEEVWTEAKGSIDRDCLTQMLVRNRDRYKVVNVDCPLPGLDQEHWVCDSADDFRFCEEIAKRLRNRAPFYTDILAILDKEPKLRQINKWSIRNERFYEALAEERLPARTFEQSHRIFERASKVIPLAAQTYSKSFVQFPLEKSPLYVSHGDGACIFDVDGNRYVDLINAIYPVVLGYCDPDVDRAIRDQLDSGISFSLATKLESELAETLCRLIPCAEMVKFGKSGTDVTTAAVRLARAYTGRDHIIVGGYHGWSDWSIGTSNRHGGIPEGVRQLSGRISTNECGIIELPFSSAKLIAAIIVEDLNDPQWLKHLREFSEAHGIVLIFDEIITGFRYAMGGAQELYGVTPDLACFGKSMANGMPISALVGKREIMAKLETPDVFYSGTFFGETLSIAAAIATIKKMEEKDVIHHLWVNGIHLEHAILKSIREHGLTEHIKLDGHYSCLKVVFHGQYKDNIRSLFMQTMFQNGVLIQGSNALSYAMNKPEMKRIYTAYDATFRCIAEAIKSGNIHLVDPVEAAPLRVTA
jgi:glutamate-1-semialdehyde 2,1-aminomutase/spore coat polysaccharide biosynthesis protein SpsF